MHAANHPVGVVITPSCLTDVPDVVLIQTSGQRLYEFTNTAADFVPNASVETGLLTVFVRHTSF